MSPRLTKKTTTQHQKQCPNKQKNLEEKTSYKDYTKPTYNDQRALPTQIDEKIVLKLKPINKDFCFFFKKNLKGGERRQLEASQFDKKTKKKNQNFLST